MPKDTSDADAQAAALVQAIAKQSGGSPTDTQLAPIVQAVALDLKVSADRAIADGERIAKLETQTRVLADAIVAITETSDALAPAVKAVKDEM